MGEFKKILTSGSVAHFKITDSSNTSFKTVVVNPDTGKLFSTGSYGGGGGISGDGDDIIIGTATDGLNAEPSTQTIQGALNNIDNILELLAPSKDRLDSRHLAFTSSTSEVFSAISPNGDLTSSITTANPQFISTSADFFWW